MFSLRTRKVLRDIWDYKARTAMVILTIAIGVFSVGSLGRVGVILSRNLSQTYLAANPASASLTTLRSFDESVVKRVSRMPEVNDAEGRNGVWARVNIGPDRWQGIRLIARDDYNSLIIDTVQSEAGAWPLGDDEIVLERTSFALLPFEIGDTLTFQFNDDVRKELVLVGTVHDVTQISSAFSLVSYGYINSETLRNLVGARDFNTLDITVADQYFDRAHVEEVADQVKRVMESSGQTVIEKDIPEPGKHELNNIMQSVLLLLAVLAGLAVLLSVFLVVNIISALLTQQTQQIGAIKAVGGTSRQIIGMYMQSISVFGFVALAVAVPLGIIFSYLAAPFFAHLINFDVNSYQTTPLNFLIELAAGVIVPAAVAVYPVLRAAHLTVRESIGFAGAGQSQRFGVSGFEQLLGKIPGLPVTVLYPLRNVFRQKVRVALATIALSVAGAILIAVVSVRASFQLTMQEISAYWQEDINLYFYEPRHIDQLEKTAMQVPGVERIEPRLTKTAYRIRPDGSESPHTTDLFGLQPGSKFIEPQLIDGRWLQPGDTNAVVINIDFLNAEPGVEVGDELTLKVEGQEISWQVVGIVTSQVIGGSELLMSPIAYVDYSYLSQVTREPNRAVRILIDTTQDDAAFLQQVITGLERAFAERGISISFTLLKVDMRAALEDAFNILLSLLQLASIIFGIVGGLGLMSMMSLNVLERTREVGIIRSAGGVRKQLGQIVVIEGVFVGLLSWVFAVILAYPLSIVLGNVLGRTLLSTPLKSVFPIKGPLLWLGLVIILAVISSLLPARSAGRLSIRETLSYE